MDRLKSFKIKISEMAFAVFAVVSIIAVCAGCENDDSLEKTSKTMNQQQKDTDRAVNAAGERDTDKAVNAAEEQDTDKAVNAAGEQDVNETAEDTKEQEANGTTTIIQAHPEEETTVSGGESATAKNQEGTIQNVVRDKNNRIVAIDAGHQSRGNSEKEPVGPGADAMKAKVAGGTKGVATGKPEYELTLEISLKLKKELENRGYTVVMIRETNDVNISNAERAQIANASGATAFLRIHADGSDNSSVSGATALCPTAQNPYCAAIYEDSRRLSDAVLNNLCESTGCKKRYVSEVDNMSGINWCEIPVSIVEVGFMTNPDEDYLLSTEEYQWKAAVGIADGVDEFYGYTR